ncbi:hypothetical protein [Myroides profundi]|uniref:DUF3887 domain-containing protein n=1 Tax=Myroides profundi TaxID=480520 RepID=A0AAJ4W2L0_MYRPR|nr:hypothetical protein [Myroides profundi]AJH14993.1 hypothetical protein MPR_1813 [Myroides profundi]SEQ31454.1 hypothetical protein SAMN04488089_102310 [Myroides profundi]
MKKNIYLLILILLGSIQGFSQDMTKMSDEEIIKKSKEIAFNYINTDSFFNNSRVDNDMIVKTKVFLIKKEDEILKGNSNYKEGDKLIYIAYYRIDITQIPQAVIYIRLKDSKLVSKMRGTDGMGLDL